MGSQGNSSRIAQSLPAELRTLDLISLGWGTTRGEAVRREGRSQEKARDGGGCALGSREEWLDSGFILKGKLRGLTDGLDED